MAESFNNLGYSALVFDISGCGESDDDRLSADKQVHYIANLYFAGQRLQPPGGLPVAATTARTAIQYLCRDTNAVF